MDKSSRTDEKVHMDSGEGGAGMAALTGGMAEAVALDREFKAKCGMASDRLAHRGLRGGKPDMGQFCIDQQLGHAFDGDQRKGLFLRGAGLLPWGSDMLSVRDLLRWSFVGIRPQALA